MIFDDRDLAGRHAPGTGGSDYRVPSGSRATGAILEHRDHVHVDVAR